MNKEDEIIKELSIPYNACCGNCLFFEEDFCVLDSPKGEKTQADDCCSEWTAL